MADLFSFQHEGASFLAERNVAFLLDTMGLGKTLQAIRGADLVGAKSILVLCPAIARVNWQREFQAWQTVSRSIAVIRSSAELPRQEDVLIVSYSMLASEKARRALLTRCYDLLICDEGHSLKEPKAIRTRAVYGSRIDRSSGLANRSDRIWLLTGTLFPNHAAEAWTHVRCLLPDDLERVVGSRRKDAFVEHFCVVNDFGKIVGAKRVDELTALLRPYVLRRALEDVAIQLPPLRWSHVVIEPDSLPPKPEMTPEERAVIDAAQQKILDGELLNPTDRLPISSLRRWVGIAKSPAVADLLSQETEQTVVFAVHTAVIDTLASKLADQATVIDGRTPASKRQQFVDAFQDGSGPRVLVCQLSIASTALNLTAAAHVVFAESSWTPADLAQAAARAHRIGQRQRVLCRVLSLAGSLDESINGVLVRKMDLIQRIESEINYQPVQESKFTYPPDSAESTCNDAMTLRGQISKDHGNDYGYPGRPEDRRISASR